MVTPHFWGTMSHPKVNDTGYLGTAKVNTDIIYYTINPGRNHLCVVFV